jgi:hypothetical protein
MRRPSRKSLLDAVLPVVLWLVVWAVFTVIVLQEATPIDAARYGRDFRDTTWLPIQDFLAGGLPWDYAAYVTRHPYAQVYPLYLPSYWWPAAGFVLLPYTVGLVLWIGLCAGAIVFLVTWTIRNLCGATGWRAWVPILLCVGFIVTVRAGRLGLVTGNWAIICAAAAAVVITGRVRGVRLVLLLMIALVKPQVGLILLVLCLARNQWRAVLAALAASTALCLPIAIVAALRAGGLTELFAMGVNLFSIGFGNESSPKLASDSQIGLAASVQHLLPVVDQPWTTVLTGLAAIVTIPGYVLVRRRFGEQSPEAWVMGALAVVIVLPNNIYGAAVLIPGLVALAWRLVFDRDRVSVAQLRTAVIVVIVMGVALSNPYLNPLRPGPLVALFGGGPRVANFIGGFGLFVGGLALLTAALIVREPRSSPDVAVTPGLNKPVAATTATSTEVDAAERAAP